MTQRSPCIFCGSRENKLSKEHVWPKWLRKHIELGEGPAIKHSRIRGREAEILTRETWTTPPIDWQVKGPCQSCNEGWMERLEGEARPVLVPMLEDKRVVLDAVRQHVLTRWATLRVLVAQHGHPSDMRAIAPERYARFYDTRSLPVGAQVWTGRYGGAGGWPTDYRHVELYISAPPDRSEPARPNGYVVAFSVGYVAFLYFGHEIVDGPVLDIGNELGRFLVPVWPVTGPVSWPPPGVLAADGLESAIRSLPITF